MVEKTYPVEEILLIRRPLTGGPRTVSHALDLIMSWSNNAEVTIASLGRGKVLKERYILPTMMVSY